MNDRTHTPDWEELEMWIASFDAAPNPASVVQAMKNSGWREPAYEITTIEELHDLPYDALLHWMDDAGLPHAMFAAQLQPPNAMEGMWTMTVIHEALA